MNWIVTFAFGRLTGSAEFVVTADTQGHAMQQALNPDDNLRAEIESIMTRHGVDPQSGWRYYTAVAVRSKG